MAATVIHPSPHAGDPRRGLAAFVLLSLLIHGAGLLLAPGASAPRPAGAEPLRIALRPPAAKAQARTAAQPPPPPHRPARSAPPPPSAAPARARPAPAPPAPPATTPAAARLAASPAAPQPAPAPPAPPTATPVAARPAVAPPRPAPAPPTLPAEAPTERAPAAPRPAPPPTAAPAAGARAAPASPPAGAATAREALLALLRPRLRYPALARRRGWQGTVELEVRLDPAGRLATVRIARTSGHGILDREALRALAALRGRRVAAAGGTLRLPVIFRLVTG